MIKYDHLAYTTPYLVTELMSLWNKDMMTVWQSRKFLLIVKNCKSQKFRRNLAESDGLKRINPEPDGKLSFFIFTRDFSFKIDQKSSFFFL